MSNIIDEEQIHRILAHNTAPDKVYVDEILAKARECCGLDLTEAATLMAVTDQELVAKIFTTAKTVKEAIYGKRIVIFAPLYVSNVCYNECLYCAFRVSNRALKRQTLDMAQISSETRSLIQQGHKRILLVAGEAYPNDDFSYVLEALATSYAVKEPNGSAIKRINVNLAPLTDENFRLLREASIGTYQLFQETYHRSTYQAMHVGGKKADYDWRLSVFDRALRAGIDDVGLGVLFGLYDWRFEVLALLAHASYLEHHYGVGLHTISVPRIEPAFGSEIANLPPAAVNDDDFYKIVAILRLALPACGLILSTRENLAMRRHALELGISQISAGSRTSPGGYNVSTIASEASQFVLGDNRSLDEVVYDLVELGYFPSFCTACYRLGRTGEDFMDLAKHGKIKEMCTPNALLTFVQYLNTYASNATRAMGQQIISEMLKRMESKTQQLTVKLLAKTDAGECDLYV